MVKNPLGFVIQVFQVDQVQAKDYQHRIPFQVMFSLQRNWEIIILVVLAVASDIKLKSFVLIHELKKEKKNGLLCKPEDTHDNKTAELIIMKKLTSISTTLCVI